MNIESIGKNIRKYRQMRKLHQEDLAEKVGLSTNYVGALERGEKIPSLETLIDILNTLDKSADMVLCNVLRRGYEMKNSLLNDELGKLSPEDLAKVYKVIEALIQQ